MRLPAFRFPFSFVIARSGSDEAIQNLSAELDCFASTYALCASVDSNPP
jgi:hypothetical protein